MGTERSVIYQCGRIASLPRLPLPFIAVLLQITFQESQLSRMKANNPFAGDPRSWSIAKVERWVEYACNTGGYGDLFTTNHIDGKVLGSLTMAQVLEMAPAMTMGHRIKLEKALFEVKQRIMCFNQSSEPPKSASLEEKRQGCLELWGKMPRFHCIFKDTQIFQLVQAPGDRSFESDQEYIEFLVRFNNYTFEMIFYN